MGGASPRCSLQSQEKLMEMKEKLSPAQPLSTVTLTGPQNSVC